ncbi:putative NRPS-like protein biosynthetic cluster [Aspergillus flavus]|uniref:NRPS-like enzyme n=1 Tax=Aspergillus flavus TaxID=5059 RepID=A0AB74CB37_ASPFL|nr:NRPS-like enzyme [Aspergillus flavus]UDD65733.1 putative NRPS-like protein biosynthetic cluster [Aspergillus flavus]
MGSTNFDQRLMCRVVDELAESKPEQLFCVQPISSDLSQGWRNVSMRDLAGAVDYTARWIEMAMGKGFDFQPLAYIGANDIRYVVFYLACMKTGYAALLPSTRNSIIATSHVLSATECSKVVYSAERHKIAEEIGDSVQNVRLYEIPSLWEVFGAPAEPYAFNANFYDLQNKPCIIIHSSGTTGLPKPVYLTNGFFSVIDNFPRTPTPPGRLNKSITSVAQGRRLFTMAPMFHLMGLVILSGAIFHNTPVVLSPERPMTPGLLSQILETARPEVAMLTPSVIQELSAFQEGLEGLQKFKAIVFGGAPLSPEVGSKLNEKVALHSIIGSSEAGFMGALICTHSEDWEYFEWNPYSGIHMESVDDGVFEAVIRKDEHHEFLCIFHTYPDITEYRTKDLFTPHPTRPGLWKYHGRLDDVIVLSNGEKFNPTDMENIVESHPLVSRAIIIGQGRFQASLLIQPNWGQWSEDQDKADFIDRIWPTVERANGIAPGHARVLRTKVALAKQDTPFALTPKGSVQRRQISEDYETEINALYAGEDEECTDDLPQSTDLEDIKQYIHTVVSQLLSVERISDTSDIFSLGMDSLQTLQLSKILQTAVRHLSADKNSEPITSQKLYAYPTLDQLSQYVYRLLKGETMEEKAEDEEATRPGRIEGLINKYTNDLSQRAITSFNRSTKNAVILTGSTGSLGNYILNELLSDREIPMIYCLNRAEDARQKQITSFKEKGFTIPHDFDERVEFIHAHFGALNLGLSIDKYNELTKSVDLIIHNAWKVNFNHKVEAFEDPHIRGIRSLVDFSLRSAHSAHIHFISSISTVSAWGPQDGPSVPEIPLDDPDVALRQGYGESKFVGERICAIASSIAGVPSSIHRVGQIAGPTTEKGLWNRQEWLPSLVATSKTLGKLPNTLGTMPVDWIPIDIMAKIVVDITNSRRATEDLTRTAAFHLVNPRSSSWESLIPAIKKHYKAEVVDMHDWMATLEAFRNPTDGDLQDKPALKIIDFYKGLASNHGTFTSGMETVKTQAASQAMCDLGPIDGAIMENWIKQWQF